MCEPGVMSCFHLEVTQVAGCEEGWGEQRREEPEQGPRPSPHPPRSCTDGPPAPPPPTVILRRERNRQHDISSSKDKTSLFQSLPSPNGCWAPGRTPGTRSAHPSPKSLPHYRGASPQRPQLEGKPTLLPLPLAQPEMQTRNWTPAPGQAYKRYHFIVAWTLQGRLIVPTHRQGN